MYSIVSTLSLTVASEGLVALLCPLSVMWSIGRVRHPLDLSSLTGMRLQYDLFRMSGKCNGRGNVIAPQFDSSAAIVDRSAENGCFREALDKTIEL